MGDTHRQRCQGGDSAVPGVVVGTTTPQKFSCIEALSPLPQGATEGSEYGGDTAPHGSLTRSPPHLLPLRSSKVVRCSPRLRRCSSATRSAHRRLWSSVQQVGVGHSEPPVKGSRLRSPEPLCPRRMQVPTQKQEAPPSTSEGRVAPSAVGWGSSRNNTVLSNCYFSPRRHDIRASDEAQPDVRGPRPR